MAKNHPNLAITTFESVFNLQVLEQRHLHELADLDARFEAERQNLSKQIDDDMKNKLTREIEQIQSKYDARLGQLDEKDATSSRELDRRSEELTGKMETEIQKLKERFHEQHKMAQAGSWADLEARQAKAKLETREKHYQVIFIHPVLQQNLLTRN